MQGLDAQRVLRLYDLTKAQLIAPNWAYSIAGNVNGSEEHHLVIESARPDTKRARGSTAPALADGAGGCHIE